MSDDIKRDQDESNKPLDDKQVVSRRRFAKTGLGGGAVLMSLLSRPALGTGYNDPRCTGSILASIDAGSSLHDFEPDECRFGCTPGFWCGGAAGLAWNKIAQLTGINLWSAFSQIFICGPGPAIFDHQALFPMGGDTPLEDILCVPNSDTPAFLKQSARHSIAAWLNATIMQPFGTFGPTPGQIVDGYCDRYAAWHNNQTDVGLIADLQGWHISMKNLNERGCPLNNDQNNMFYD